jgi:hypothetical protein
MKINFFLIIVLLLCFSYNRADGQTNASNQNTGTAVFRINVIDDGCHHHHHWCWCIGWFIEWFICDFHGQCNAFKPPYNDENTADCALEHIGFSKDRIKWIKSQNENCHQVLLIQEVLCNPKFFSISNSWFSYWGDYCQPGHNNILVKNYTGKPIIINLCGF